jgi:hypothetical protein
VLPKIGHPILLPQGIQALLLRLHSIRLPNQRIDLLSDKVWGVGCVAKN